MKNTLILLLLLIFLDSCSLGEKLELKNFDSVVFKKDRLACNKQRTQFIENLKSQKDAFLGVSENEIYSQLGRYDYQAVDAKNEKVWVYFLESGSQCTNIRNKTKALTLVLKLNSVSLVKEVIIQKGGFE